MTVFRDARSLVGHETLEDERYVVIKAYKCTVSEIWRDSFVLAYIACTSYPYIIQSLPSLVPSHTPSFPSLLSTVLSNDGKLGVGLGTRLESTDSVITYILVGKNCAA